MNGDSGRVDLDALEQVSRAAQRSNRPWPADYNQEYSVCERTEPRAVQEYVDAFDPTTALALLVELRRHRETEQRVRELAEQWRYKGEFGWGAWQEGEGPDEEGWHLDRASTELLAALDGTRAIR